MARITAFADIAERGEAGAVFSSLKRNLRACKTGERLVLEGNAAASVLFVLEGWISLSKSLADGASQIIDFLLPGDVAIIVAADGTTSCHEVEALTDGLVGALTHSNWEHILQASPHMRLLDEHGAAAAQARISERMLRLGKGSAQMRMAYALLELCVRLHSIGETHDHAFHLPLSQKHLGEFTGLSSVHVCRTLRRFTRQGIVETEDHLDVKILDLDALSAVAGIEVDRLKAEIVGCSQPQEAIA